MGRIQAQTAGYVLCLHHAQIPRSCQGCGKPFLTPPSAFIWDIA